MGFEEGSVPGNPDHGTQGHGMDPSQGIPVSSLNATDDSASKNGKGALHLHKSRLPKRFCVAPVTPLHAEVCSRDQSVPSGQPSCAVPHQLVSSELEHALVNAKHRHQLHSVAQTTSCMSETQESVEELQQLLANSHRELLKLQRERFKSGSRTWIVKYAAAMEKMQELVSLLGPLVEQNVQLKQRRKLLFLKLSLAEQEQRWLQRGATSPALSARLLSKPCSLPSSGQLVSLAVLPDEAGWDMSWDARLQSLTTRDLLMLHREWVQQSALLLPQVQALEARSPACVGDPHCSLKMQQLHDKYNFFRQRIMRVCPKAWQQTVHYSLETMEPLHQPPNAASIIHFWDTNFPEVVPKLQQIHFHYTKVLADLDAECVHLQRRHADLASISPPAAAWRMDRMHDPSSALEMHEVLIQLNATLHRRQTERHHMVQALYCAPPASTMGRAMVMFYPMCMNGQTL